MKIGIYDPYLDDLGGGEKYMMTIAQCLSKEHNVNVFWDRPNDVTTLMSRFSLDLSSAHLVPNIFSAKFSTLQRFLATRSYDSIIFLSDGSIPFVGSKKLFAHIQQPLAIMQTKSFLEKIKLSRVTKFFCNSLYTKSFIDKKFSLKTVILYPPVTLHPQKEKKENIILHVGRFRVKNVGNGDYKKQSVMQHVFIDMVKKGLKGWKFVLAVSIQDNDQEAFAKMKEAAKGHPIEFLVNKSNESLWKAYSKAKIYWHASGFGENLSIHPEYAEHFGISTVEAMGAGAVPVVINAGGQREIVKNGENGLLWDTLEELEEKTLQLMQDKKLWEKLSKNAQITAKKFDGEYFCKNINTLISS